VRTGFSFILGHTLDLPTSFVSDHSPPSHIYHRNDIEAVFRWIDGIGNARNGKFQVSAGQTARGQDLLSLLVVPQDVHACFFSDHSPPYRINHSNDTRAVFRRKDDVRNARNENVGVFRTWCWLLIGNWCWREKRALLFGRIRVRTKIARKLWYDIRRAYGRTFPGHTDFTQFCVRYAHGIMVPLAMRACPINFHLRLYGTFPAWNFWIILETPVTSYILFWWRQGNDLCQQCV
jgi:hypothetical protein